LFLWNGSRKKAPKILLISFVTNGTGSLPRLVECAVGGEAKACKATYRILIEQFAAV